MTDGKPRLGFIGIGIMGTAMTRRLLERGWRVHVWNLEPEAIPPVVEAGAVAASSPAAVAEASDIVLICVLNTAAVENCVFGPNGIAGAAGGAGKVLVDMSTIHPQATRDMAARLLRETGMRWVDAPLSGGPQAAREGSMTVMAGGAEADVDSVQEVMRDLAANVTRMGPVGAGQTTKLVNQAIVGTGYVLMAEALSLAEAAGIDAARLPECLAGGFADSVLLRRLYPQMQQRAFEPPTGYARQLLKDMKAVKEFAHDLGLGLPLVERAAERYGEYVEQGNEMRDSASIVRIYDRERGQS
jgi:3-hydroxyisobutyrate dehydrogenase-like beta-hydroxyacid dehydrogenase